MLLVPCTDWFITFTQLGGGDSVRATALTPIALGLQLVLLPAYLWLLGGGEPTSALSLDQVWPALLVLLLPLGLALLTERWAAREDRRSRRVGRLAWAPVPLLGLVILLVATSRADEVGRDGPWPSASAPATASSCCRSR